MSKYFKDVKIILTGVVLNERRLNYSKTNQTQYWEEEMRLLLMIMMLALLWQSQALAQSTKYSDSELLDRPLMERYILDELKSLRQDQQELEKKLVVQITDRELAVADKSLNYANVTVTYWLCCVIQTRN